MMPRHCDTQPIPGCPHRDAEQERSMHDDGRMVERRLDRTLAERVGPAAYAGSVPLELAVWRVPDEPVPVTEALSATYEPFRVGQDWGRPWATSWFRGTGRV